MYRDYLLNGHNTTQYVLHTIKKKRPKRRGGTQWALNVLLSLLLNERTQTHSKKKQIIIPDKNRANKKYSFLRFQSRMKINTDRQQLL